MLHEERNKNRKNTGFARDKKGRFTKDNPSAWKPGECPPGAGRPPGKTGPQLWPAVRKLLESEHILFVGPNGEKLKGKDYLALKTIVNAAKGNGPALRIIFDRDSPYVQEFKLNNIADLFRDDDEKND